MGALPCRIRQDQEPDIDEVLSRQVWSAFTKFGFKYPIWNTIKEINGLPLPEDDWQYHVSINHTAMCENTESIINGWSLGIYYFPEQAARTDIFHI